MLGDACWAMRGKKVVYAELNLQQGKGCEKLFISKVESEGNKSVYPWYLASAAMWPSDRCSRAVRICC